MSHKILISALIVASFHAGASWSVTENTDPMTDVKTKIAISSNGLIGGNCERFLFGFNKYMNQDGEMAFVTMRIDKNDATFAVGEWINNYAAITTESLKKRGIYDQMISGNKIIFQSENYKGYKEIASDDLLGFTKAMKLTNCQ
ncbi:hypothetical protein ACPF37_003529 [Vibrio cholerae]|uniref:hypothetical protein n=1 Tax=Vibrio TaxID=662 RepID=UPI0004E3D3A1|nr:MULTISPECIES: hypothetical protein [Vibrio]EII5643557.1 hypothetical protein [Vibrio cholerae]KFD86203.1 hypothetical protein DN42_3516 [Vibrio cholerae]MBW5433048.1 hypothetical protein [Vibrio cholerae]NAO21212.1 hypothetical protein [Vibrio cholerae]NAO59083.1 hypothetical protein [Vibrio cholerae]